MTNQPSNSNTPSSPERPTTAGVPPAIVQGALAAWRQTGKQHVFCLTGSSMQPLIHESDTLLVSFIWQPLRRGDVLVFQSGNRLVAHRVLRWRAGADGMMVWTKGDNAPYPDPPIAEGEIVGRAVAIRKADREIRLDTRRERVWGWLIASSSLVGLALRRVGRRRVSLPSWLSPGRAAHAAHCWLLGIANGILGHTAEQPRQRLSADAPTQDADEPRQEAKG